MTTAPPCVALFNTSPDTINMLRSPLQRAGLAVVAAYTYDVRDGVINLGEFMDQHQPSVVVYDVAPPYDENWVFFQHLRSAPSLRECQFVITSTNSAYVQALAGRDDRVYEIIGRPFDIGLVVQAVREALRVRPTR